MGAAFPMMRDQLPPSANNTFVIPELKVAYVSVPKTACTSLKWMIAGLSGEDPSSFGPALRPEVTRATTIHRRHLWTRTPRLSDLSDDELAQIDPSAEWFVFAVVRHPTQRLWSAWQSKLLLHEPQYMRKFAGEPWLPEVPTTTDDVAESFRRFVLAIAAEPEGHAARDPHFRPQRRLLTPRRTPYTRIYRTSEIDELVTDLTKHVRGRGSDQPVEMPMNNETPLPLLARMVPIDVSAAIWQLYGGDFEQFNFGDPRPVEVATDPEYPQALLDEVGRLIERSERIGDLAAIATQLQIENDALRDEIAGLRAASGPLHAD